MFKIVAVIFAVVNGVPSEQPLTVLPYNQKSFETMEACMAFPKSEEGTEIRETIKAMVMSQRGSIIAKLGCTKADEDNSI